MMDKYEVITFRSGADGVFVAEEPGRMAYGRTQAAALRSPRSAMKLRIKAARELTRPRVRADRAEFGLDHLRPCHALWN
jgi:predicted RNase H-like HicB family nuclease